MFTVLTRLMIFLLTLQTSAVLASAQIPNASGDNALRDGFTIGGALSSASPGAIKQSRGLVDDAWVEDMARNTSASILASTSALQFYSDKGQLASMGANSSWEQRYAALRGTEDRHTDLRKRSEDGGVGKLEDGINNATDTDSVAALQSLAQNFTTAYGNKDTTASIYDEETDSLAQGAKGFTARDEQGTRIGLNISHTDISDVDDFVSTLGKENYLAGETQITDGSTREALGHLSGGRLGTMWTTDNQRRGLHTGGYKNRSRSDWRELTKGDSLLRSNNQNVSRINPMHMEYRQLHYSEGNLIALTGAAFAYQQGISVEAGIAQLRNEAMRLIDSEYDHLDENQVAGQWLSDLSAAYLKDDQNAYAVELFGATQAQRDNHELFDEHGATVDQTIANWDQNPELKKASQFLIKRIANARDAAGTYAGALYEDTGVADGLQAVARSTLRAEAFAEGYGNGELIYGNRWHADGKLMKRTQLGAYDAFEGGLVVDSTDAHQLGQGSWGVLRNGDKSAIIEAYGLNPSQVSKQRGPLLSQKGVMAAIMAYDSSDSFAPLLAYNTPNTHGSELQKEVQRRLGGNLPQVNQDGVRTALANLDTHASIDLSPASEYATLVSLKKQATQDNETPLLAYTKGLDELTDRTSFWDTPDAHVSHFLLRPVTDTVSHASLLLSDDQPPQHLRDQAAAGLITAPLEVVGNAYLLQGAVQLGKLGVNSAVNASRKGLQSLDDAVQAARMNGLQELRAVGAQVAQADLAAGMRRMVSKDGDIIAVRESALPASMRANTRAESIQKLPEGYHSRVVNGKTIIARNPGQGNLPKLLMTQEGHLYSRLPVTQKSALVVTNVDTMPLRNVVSASDTKDYGVALFGKDNLDYYTRESATIGREGKSFFFMPLEDSVAVKNAADAARYTGRAPSAEKAYLEGGDIYGLSFQTNEVKIRKPIAADAEGWPHYLDGGYTAVKTGNGTNAGYLINPTREYVMPGGNSVPEGSVLFRLGVNGEWVPIRRF